MKIQCVCGKAYWPKQAWLHKACVANRASNTVANRSSEVKRVQAWREANRERYNANQREVMRRRREAHVKEHKVALKRELAQLRRDLQRIWGPALSVFRTAKK